MPQLALCGSVTPNALEPSPSVLPALVRAVHAGAVVALEALSTLEMLLRQGTSVLTQFADIVSGPDCMFFVDLAEMMAHSIFLLEQVRCVILRGWVCAVVS